MATLVTGYVRLNSGHRGHERYVELGRRLIGLGLPTIAFYDGPPADLQPTSSTTVLPASLEACWLYGPTRRALPPVPNDAKDTTNYVTVQHQKSAWLAEACRRTGGTCVWVDLGILHVPDPPSDAEIVDFFERVAAANPQRITMPAPWPMEGRPQIDWTKPAWYVAGGVVVMPAHAAEWFHAQAVDVATLQLEASRRATWEVNTWSAIVRDHRGWFDLYAANHDRTLFTNYLP
jgi:hypothetical protein